DDQIIENYQINSHYIIFIMPMLIINESILNIYLYNANNELINTTQFIVETPINNAQLVLNNYNESINLVDLDEHESFILNFKINSLTTNNLFNIELYHYSRQFDDSNVPYGEITKHRIEIEHNVNLSSVQTLKYNYRDVLKHLPDDANIMHKIRVRLVVSSRSQQITNVPLITWGWQLYKLHKKVHGYCSLWHSRQANASIYLSLIPKCPCSIPTIVSGHFPTSFNEFVTDDACDSSKPNSCQLHVGATHCYRRSFKISGPGAQCCYDVNGTWITEPEKGAGTLDVQTASGSLYQKWILHIIADVLPYFACCKSIFATKDSCKLYYEKRPAGECEHVSLPITDIGNSHLHFLTHDGLHYTFPGHGEYILVQTFDTKIPLEIQVRLELIPPPDIPSEDTNKSTAIVAFAIKNSNYSKVQFELLKTSKVVEIRVNNYIKEV
ncbi:unnamed protein product, partial [Didymodactylos carnosus]